MTDRETVIAALEYCAVGTKDCHGCPMKDDCKGVSNGAMAAAARLLKEQEPRLVTKEEFRDADEWGYLPAWFESTEGRVYCECISERALGHGAGRYWTAKPTEDQRKAVKWDAAV